MFNLRHVLGQVRICRINCTLCQSIPCAFEEAVQFQRIGQLEEADRLFAALSHKWPRERSSTVARYHGGFPPLLVHVESLARHPSFALL